MPNRRWVLLLPWIVFGIGVWLFFKTENTVRVQFARAEAQWREGNYTGAIQLYRTLQETQPQSRFAAAALWEIGTIYYVNAYDVSRAMRTFQQLVTEYPDSPWTVQAYLKLAEIHEVEMNDIPAALECWKEVLRHDVGIRLRQQVRFNIADAYFKMNQFEEALDQLESLTEQQFDPVIAQKSRVRTGTILQIRRMYSESIDVFQQVLDARECPACRVQAQLGLIESYEMTDNLPRAIETVASIDEEHYSVEMKNALLERLNQKQKIYDPKLRGPR